MFWIVALAIAAETGEDAVPAETPPAETEAAAAPEKKKLTVGFDDVGWKGKLSFSDAGHMVRQLGAPSTLPDISYGQPFPSGALGFEFEGEGSLFNAAILQTSVRFGGYKVDILDELSALNLSNWHLAAGYRHPLINTLLTIEGTIGVHGFNYPVFAYNSSLTEAQLQMQGHVGLRVGIGARGHWKSLHYGMEFAETFAWVPVASHLGFDFDVAIPGLEFGGMNLTFGMGTDLDWRYTRPLSGDAGRTRDMVTNLTFGVGVVRATKEKRVSAVRLNGNRQARGL